MADTTIDACVPVDISDDDVIEAMKEIQGYLDITPGDFKEVYLKAYQHALRRLTRSVKVKEVMTTEVTYVFRKTPIKEVAQLMARKKVSGVPVLKADGSVAGVISERDFLFAMSGKKLGLSWTLLRSVLEEASCLAAPIEMQCAEDIMSSPAITISPDTSLIEVANIMANRNINRLPVVDTSGKLIGIVSRANVVKGSI